MNKMLNNVVYEFEVYITKYPCTFVMMMLIGLGVGMALKAIIGAIIG